MSHNTWIHSIVTPFVRPLARTRVEPNHITTLRLAAGLGAAGALAVGDDAWRHLGAGLFLLAMLFDRADGVLARITSKFSPFGHKYDLVSDAVCNAVVFVGLGVGLRSEDFGLLAPLMGVAAGIAVTAILWMVLRAESEDGERAAELGGLGRFDPDDAMIAVPVGIWLGMSHGLLVAAAIGAPVFAVLFFSYHKWYLRA